MSEQNNSKPKRKAISKKMRFEVFKRDSFTCQYCGRKAPDVILEIDHIKPVAKGGENTLLNLITSCKECNRGKGKIPLTEKLTLEKERKRLDEMQERREQMKMIMQWHDELLDIENEEISCIEKALLDDGLSFTERGRRNALKQIKRFGFEIVLKAARLAKESYIDNGERCKKYGGIAYNKVFVDKEW